MTVGVAGLIIGGVGAIGGAMIGANATKDASSASAGATDRATEEQGRQYDQTREDYAPWRAMGEGAIGRMEDTMAGDMSSFQTSPGYNFRMDEGNRNLTNSYSNNSGGGNAMRAMMDYGQNFASNEFGNWWNRNAGMAGAGQSAVGGTAMAGMNAANQNSNSYMQNASNQGNIGMWGAQNQNNMLQGGLSNSLYWAEKKWGTP